MYSEGYGLAKFDKKTLSLRREMSQVNSKDLDKNFNNQADKQEEIRKKMHQIKEQENMFRRVLAMKGLKINDMEGDGNCLFRAVSDQIYNGDQSHFALIRQACMDYIESERDFYIQFVIGGEEFFDEYVERKRMDGVWGDDIELQAMSEIYNRPIEIYAYRAEPMRTFHEE